MNLGDANLKSVNASRPQLLHSQSKQSVAASDDYYSFSDYASDASSLNSRVTVVRYETPPSRIRSPHQSKDRLGSEMTLPSKKQKERLRGDGALSVKFDKSASEKPEGAQSMSKVPGDNSPPTPGVDDTPYIRFAIDQLTRDEELLGARPSVVEPEYPVERIIPDEGLKYYTPGNAGDPPRQPVQERQQIPEPSVRPLPNEAFIPAEPDHTFRHPFLDFVPTILRPIPLLIVILVILCMIAALLFCTMYSTRHRGLWDYSAAGGGRYFVFEFLPQLLAILIILWLFVIQSALYRIIPFCILANERSLDGVIQNLPLLPSNFILPDLAHFKHGDPLIGACLLIFWVANFTVPLQSCLFQTRLEVQNGHGTWRWTTVQGVGYTLVGLYALLLASLLAIFARFLRPLTGLLWDPVSIADLIPLIQRSNVLDSFSRSEVTISPRTQIARRVLRLGYWTTTRSPETFYAIGESNGPIRRYSLQAGRMKEKSFVEANDFDVEDRTTNRDSNFTRNIHSPFVRYRWTPPFLRDTFVILYIIAALVLFVAFTVVSYVHRAVEGGFEPLLRTMANADGFSSSNFLYSFIPALLGTFLFLAYQPIYLSFASLQPFVSLSSPAGSFAEHSLLLSYPSMPPLINTFAAVTNGHYKVAYISFVSLLSIAIPVLAGGTFTAQFFPDKQKILISANMPSYYALTVFLALYASSFVAVFPTRKRYLPHPIRTIADIISFVYQSPLLKDMAFQHPKTKADLVARLVTDPPGEKGRPKYAFGVFTGRDGTEHLGVDRLQRPGSMMIVTTGGR